MMHASSFKLWIFDSFTFSFKNINNRLVDYQNSHYDMALTINFYTFLYTFFKSSFLPPAVTIAPDNVASNTRDGTHRIEDELQNNQTIVMDYDGEILLMWQKETLIRALNFLCESYFSIRRRLCVCSARETTGPTTQSDVNHYPVDVYITETPLLYFAETFQDQDLYVRGYCALGLVMAYSKMYCEVPFHEEMQIIGSENWCDLDSFKQYGKLSIPRNNCMRWDTALFGIFLCLCFPFSLTCVMSDKLVMTAEI